MCAGEAHWQNGVVERHIGTFKRIFDKLLMDWNHEDTAQVEVPDDESIQRLVTELCQVKNDFGKYGGSSPSQ